MNYSKVEAILGEGMRRLKMRALLKETGKGVEKRGEEVILALKYELQGLKKLDPKLYQHMAFKPSEVKILLENANELTDKELELAKEYLSQVRHHKKIYSEKNPPPSDEELIEQQKKRHLTKRHNVNDNWLPLD